MNTPGGDDEYDAEFDGGIDGGGIDDGGIDGGGDAPLDTPFEGGGDFPDEADWLAQPMPELPEGPLVPMADDDGDFVSRVLRARDDERHLDAELARLDEALPPSLLQQFAVPPVDGGFVAATVAAIQRDRQQRWRSLLARYVAPEPSPQFVNRTLTALFDAEAASRVVAAQSNPTAPTAKPVDSPAVAPVGPPAGSPAGSPAALPAALPAAAQPSPSQQSASPSKRRSALAWQHDARRVDGRRSHQTGRWLWAAGAAAAVVAALLLRLPQRHHTPFELRVALATPAERAWSDAVSPLPVMLAAVAAAEEPHGLFDTPVDGLWLGAATEAHR